MTPTKPRRDIPVWLEAQRAGKEKPGAGEEFRILHDYMQEFGQAVADLISAEFHGDHCFALAGAKAALDLAVEQLGPLDRKVYEKLIGAQKISGVVVNVNFDGRTGKVVPMQEEGADA